MTTLPTSMIIKDSVEASNINMVAMEVGVVYVVIQQMHGLDNMRLLVVDTPMVSSLANINLVRTWLSRLMLQPTIKDISCSSSAPITTPFRIHPKNVSIRQYYELFPVERTNTTSPHSILVCSH